jgi:hypothetical protein
MNRWEAFVKIVAAIPARHRAVVAMFGFAMSAVPMSVGIAIALSHAPSIGAMYDTVRALSHSAK